jgi:glycosyltransferase involved in cell wall biosynthesis
MYPTAEAPASGPFVRDQVEALRAQPDIEVEVFRFGLGARAYVDAARELRRRYRGQSFDVVHAHFGLAGWPALALRGPKHVVTLHGNDLWHPRSRRITKALLPYVDLAATVSADLARGYLGGAERRRRIGVLPCGVSLERFRPLPRAEARARLGLARDGRYLLFVANPERPVKRFDRAEALAERTDAQLKTLGATDPSEVPVWMNAANAVVVPSDLESFGLAALEALACDVPVLATPLGVAPVALAGVEGALCAPFELEAWSAAARPHLDAEDPRIEGRARAAVFSAERMAERVAVAWRELIAA